MKKQFHKIKKDNLPTKKEVQKFARTLIQQFSTTPIPESYPQNQRQIAEEILRRFNQYRTINQTQPKRQEFPKANFKDMRMDILI